MFTSITHHLHRRALFAILSNIQAGKLTLTMPDGETREFLGPNDGPSADMQITHRSGLARIIHDGKIGFCEAFMKGEVTSGDLAQLVELAVVQNLSLIHI